MVRDKDLIEAYKRLNAVQPIGADAIIADPILSLRLIREAYRAAHLNDPLLVGGVDALKVLHRVRRHHEEAKVPDPFSLPARLMRLRKGGHLPPARSLIGPLV